jgi:superfamily I DNA and/or RNA helicase
LYERNEVPRLAAKPLRVATEQLNDSQSTALCRVFEQDATFIWGPPGTGKTYTLAKIIAQGMQHGMRILATGISNVAVDNLASALVKELRRSERGTRLLRERRLLRFGYPVKNEVVRNDDLYPNKERINELRKDLAAVVAELAEVTPSNAVRRSELNERRDQLRRTLKDLDKERVGSAQVVLTTSAMCFLNAAIVTADYDMVIVDEVSMMPLVQAIAMAAFTKDKLVIAGDFKQLGPICISRSEAAQKWFATDIFTYLRGSKEYEARGLVMLDEQRRMLEPICDLINERFYRGKLRTQVDRDNVTIPGLVRTADHPVTFISVVPGHSAGVQQFGSSRRNPATAEIVLRLADRILRSNGKAELGIIAPYNGQVSLYRERMLELKWSPARMDRIKLGTIHSFQGSEYEIIIWDVVDDRTMAVGQLYRNNGGERLVNVAISRARSKLFIVGDERLFSMAGMAHMASKHLVSLFNDLRMTSKSFVSHNKIWEGQRD